MKTLFVTITALAMSLCLCANARADDATPPSEISDSALTALRDRAIIISLAGGDRRGRELSYDHDNIVLAEDKTDLVITVPRASVLTVRLQDFHELTSPPPVPLKPLAVERARHWGLQLAQGPGNVVLDVEYGHFYGFASTSIGYPIIFSGDQSQYFGFAVGLGATWKLSPVSRWHFDVMGTLTPTWWGGFSMGVGASIGFHYTSPSGFTVAFKVPVIGVAPGHSTVFGDDDGDGTSVSGGGNLVGNYFLQAAMSQPIISLGYRF